ncbi:MAG: glycosyltransferase family 39 protein [Ruminococcus sp.]|nr:glycosyltransferase family 39 protein [Ruminococcus sp.]
MKKLWEKWGKKDMESVIFLLFLLAAAIYYGWRLFALTPWYDELYTYYYFISRGPIYAAIHWPLPNNHVGYSVLSAFLDLFGNSAIGLRGISWISSLVSLCLLFMIGRKCFPKGIALVPVGLYASMELVNQLAVQGRGYALAACLYLTAFYELIEIILFHKEKPRHYVIFSCALIWALYTLPSSVYFVLPLCCIGGSFLLLEKRKKEFWRFFLTAVISALCTIGLYAMIWLAIGSNLLAKAPEGPYYGQGHVSIILHAPFRALQTGIAYMLDTPYIQSVARRGYLGQFGTWIKALFAYYYAGLSVPLLLFIGIGIIWLAAIIFKFVSHQEKEGFLEWYLLLSFLLTPLMLIIQAALPYYRVFSFFGIPVVLLLTWMVSRTARLFNKPQIVLGFTVFALAFCIMIDVSPNRIAQYSDREAAIEDAYEQMAIEKGTKICVTDCDQEYLLKYLYDIEEAAYAPQEADYVLLDKDLFHSADDPGRIPSADGWKWYVSYETIPWDYLEEEMEVRYENDRFILYERPAY